MKKLFLLLFIPIVCFGQLDKMGYSKAQVLNSHSSEPCKSDYNSILYCEDNGRYLNYGFEYNKVVSVISLTPFSSKYQAEQDVKKKINTFKREYGKPRIKGEKAYFNVGNFLVMFTYSYKGGKHMSSWMVSL